MSNPVKKERLEVPIWHKPYLTIDEATAYTGIGREKLREMTRFADCPFVLWVGKRRMIKRELFDEYIEKMYEIEKKKEQPFWKKKCLSVNETAAYTGIGRGKIRELMKRKDCNFMTTDGYQVYVIIDKFVEFLNSRNEI